MSSLCQCGYCRQSGAATMPVQSDSCSAVHMFPKSFFKHIVPALLAGLGLTALCPFTANYAPVLLYEVLETVFTTLSLLICLSPAPMQICRIASNRDLL